MSDRQPPARSVHGGALGVSDRVLREEVASRLFGVEQTLAIGRFRVRTLLGAGGMGRVFLADDPELHRPVAIKVVHPLGADPGSARLRMQAEARAQASLSDPHVVTVYEVGEHEGGLFIAMEYVPGTTLRRWLDLEPRPWTEIADKFLQAGKGLAAAHRRGLVHRDFKPENVLVDDETGRARVTDFGLVRPGSTTEAAEGEGGEGEPVTGRAGTPGYMSPEQRAGTAVDPRSDQYGYCVAFEEALAGTPAPAALLRILVRGRADLASERWPDMSTLLTAIQRCIRPKRWILGIGLATTGLAVGALLWSTGDDCSDVGGLEGVWDPDVRTAARANAEASTYAYAPTAWAAAEGLLDDYAKTWTRERIIACSSSPARDPQLERRSLDCLQMRGDDLARITGELASPGSDAARRASSFVTRLGDPSRCNDERRLSTWVVPPDIETATKRDEARAELWTALIRDESAEPQAEHARQVAQRLSDASTEAQALDVLGRAAMDSGELVQAEALLERGVARADVAGDDRIRARLLTALIYVVGSDPERFGEVSQLASQAEAALQTIGDPPLLRAHLLANLGTVKAKARPPDHEGALRDHVRAVALLRDTVGAEHPDVLSARVNLGNALGRAGRAEDSLRELESVATAAPTTWGPEHPNTARAESMVGMALMRTGELPRARTRLERALQIAEAALGSSHAQVADARYNLALILRRLEHYDEASRQLRRGLASREQTVGRDHSSLIPWLYALGRSELGRQETSAAAAVLQRALELCERDGASTDDYARVRFALAQALAATDPRRAHVLARRAADAYREAGAAKRLAEVDAFLEELSTPE